MTTPAVAIKMASAHGRHAIAEERRAKDCHLHRLGLGVGGRDHERAVLHCRKHQGGRGKLRQRPRHDPAQHAGICPGKRKPRRDQHDGEEQECEWQAKQKSDMCRSHRPKGARQLALHGIAQDLTARGGDRKHCP